MASTETTRLLLDADRASSEPITTGSSCLGVRCSPRISRSIGWTPVNKLGEIRFRAGGSCLLDAQVVAADFFVSKVGVQRLGRHIVGKHLQSGKLATLR